MRKILMLMLLFAIAFAFGTPSAVVRGETIEAEREAEQSATIEPYKRGGYRSAPGTYRPGIRNPATTTPGTNTGVRNPAAPRTTTPAPRTGLGGFFGGMFGGLALGAIIGSLFNPFAGFSMGAPFLSLLSIVLYAVVIFVVVRLFRRRKQY
ncbi:hypothetical protein [Paenibacillus sp. GYB003]|uniref:hypothetical protein n=1 Tax=Paenibacillus sp. GYB003 TaxID=2994392 RepID=UPI002F9676C6